MKTRFILLMAMVVAMPLWQTHAAAPVATDSRIKTLVYNANEVFTVTTHYGYQSNIEFGARETIDTISVGDRVAWQIIPAGRRLFIRAMEENAHTNMTIVTNLRAYQFDLRSSSADAVFGSNELTYVVRFFYPEDPAANPSSALPVAYVRDIAPPPVAAPPAPTPAPVASTAPSTRMNYRYTYSGPDQAAPVKIYDDGKATYFKFPAQSTPKIAVLTAKGESLDVPVRKTPDGLLAVDAIAPRFSILNGTQQVVVYNEASGVM